MALFRSKAEQKLLEQGLDPARLPPGQYPTEKRPVLHTGTRPQTALATWDFKAAGGSCPHSAHRPGWWARTGSPRRAAGWKAARNSWWVTPPAANRGAS